MTRSLLSTICLLWVMLGAPAMAPAASARDCIALKAVNLDDEGLLPPAPRRRLFAPFLGECIEPALLQRLLEAVATAYLQRGFVTTRPYIQPQDVADGRLRISVLIGRVEAVVDAETGRSDRRLRNAFAGQEGRILNLRRLETALEWINRPPSVDARFELRPGSEPGGTRVVVHAAEGRPWRLTLGGTAWLNGASRRVLTAEAAWDNPLDLNDILKLNLNTSRVRRQLQGGRAGGLEYSLPLGGLLASLSLSRSSYRQRLPSAGSALRATGRTDQIELKLARVLSRAQRHKLDLNLALRHQRIRNRIAGVSLDVSSYRASQVRLGLTGLRLWPWGNLTADYGFTRGTPWFGARSDGDPLSSPGLRHMFRRHELELELQARPRPGLELASLLHVQYAPDPLYDNDRLAVGSDATVRGYLDRNLLGDKAWYLRNDLRLSRRVDTPAGPLQLTFGPGLDYGRVQCQATNRESCGVVAGLSLNASAAFRGGRLALSWSRPLRRLPDGTRPDDVVRLDLTWTF